MILDFEKQYASSLQRIIREGTLQKNRTAVDVYSIAHQYFHLKNIIDEFPILRGKQVFPLMALKEMVWILFGRNDVQFLNDYGVTYWDEWKLDDGTIGKTYGYQMRKFDGHVDQLERVLNEMEQSPESRRLLINLFNPSQLNEMALPPCLHCYNFQCTKISNETVADLYKVDLHAHMRSGDSFLGLPYNFMNTAWTLYLICGYLNVRAGYVKYMPNDVHLTVDNYHLYVNHKKQAKQYIKNTKENLNEALSYKTKMPSMSTINYICENKIFSDFNEYLKYIFELFVSKDNRKLRLEYTGPNEMKNTYKTIVADIAV